MLAFLKILRAKITYACRCRQAARDERRAFHQYRQKAINHETYRRQLEAAARLRRRPESLITAGVPPWRPGRSRG